MHINLERKKEKRREGEQTSSVVREKKQNQNRQRKCTFLLFLFCFCRGALQTHCKSRVTCESEYSIILNIQIEINVEYLVATCQFGNIYHSFCKASEVSSEAFKWVLDETKKPSEEIQLVEKSKWDTRIHTCCSWRSRK